MYLATREDSVIGQLSLEFLVELQLYTDRAWSLLKQQRWQNPNTFILCFVHFLAGCICVCAHPEVDAHSGDEAPGKKGSIFEANQQTGLTHTWVPHQHHLPHTQTGREWAWMIQRLVWVFGKVLEVVEGHNSAENLSTNTQEFKQHRLPKLSSREETEHYSHSRGREQIVQTNGRESESERGVGTTVFVSLFPIRKHKTQLHFKPLDKSVCLSIASMHYMC